jgi:dienelactone hydrolase
VTRALRTIPALLLLSVSAIAAQAPFRTHIDRFEPPRFTTRAAWEARATYLREHVLASAGLVPLPARTPLNAVVFGEIRHDDFTVAKVYFESLPGFYVTGNLYRPIGDGPFPAILSPHGHWSNGRLEDTAVTSIPGRAIGLARQGFVVFTHDMVGYDDSRQLTHTFGGKREALWGLSLGGLQLWNSMRALDFLETLPYVRKDGFGATGESGGGTQTFLLAAVDPRVTVAAPVNMISLHMQGGCLCENPPGLRLDTTNVEIAATIAPRPLLMVSATGDWTNETLEHEFPAVRAIYALFDAETNVHAVRVDAPHNYNKQSREAMYAWMARWLQHAAADVKRPERSFTADSLADLLVFYGRPLPEHARTAAELTEQWIAAAQSQLAERGADGPSHPDLTAALRHALGFIAARTAGATSAAPGRRVVLIASERADVSALRAAGFVIQPIAFTPFDEAEAAKVRHFETYNRTAASQRVADIVTALDASPSAVLVADGDAGLAALLALAIVPGRRAVIDVGRFDRADDAQFVERVYIPGLRRAGDFATAIAMAGDHVTVHNAGDRFAVSSPRVEREQLSATAIASLLRR